MNINVKIKKLSEHAEIPAYQTPGSACCDLRACLDAPVTLGAGARALIPTGLAVDMGAADVVGFVFARSGLASKKGVALANGVGVIDSDYRGEIKVALVNLSGEPVEIMPGDRVAQMGFFPVFRAVFEEVDQLGGTERGDGGFGHTGR